MSRRKIAQLAQGPEHKKLWLKWHATRSPADWKALRDFVTASLWEAVAHVV